MSKNKNNISTKYNPNQDKLVYASETPDIPYLWQEYNRSTQNGGNVANIMENDDIRLSRWAGQTADGKKHSESRLEGDAAFPFEGASDVRCRLVDRTINDIVAMLMTTFDRCKVKVKGTEFNDYDFAGSANILMDWLTQSKLRNELRSEAELLAQYTQQYGWSGLHIIWEQESALRYQTIRMDEINALCQKAQQGGSTSSLKDLATAIMAPEQEQYAVDLITQYLADVDENDVKKAVRDLRETGKAEIPETYVSKNMPTVVSLKPFDEISFPPETINIQDARVIFRRVFMTEMEIRSQAAQYGWSEDFVNQAVSVAGLRTNFHDPNILPAATLINYQINRNMHLIEVVYAYSRLIKEDGTQGIYCTIFCPRAGSEIYASHELLGYAHNKYPFVIYRRERLRRPIQESRGVPEVAMTDQYEIKAQHDSIRDRTAFTTMPPVLVKKRYGGINKIAPGIHLPITSPDDYKFMTPPQSETATAFNLINIVEQNHAAYFGIYHPNIPPQRTQVTQQYIVNNWLDVWSEAFNMLFSLCLQYLDPAEIESITNKPIPQNMSAISNQYDFQIKYDVREIDTDFVMEKLKAIMQFVMPLDSAGVIDKSKLVRAAIEAIDPDKAKDLIVEQASASQMLYKDIQSDIGLMMLGNEANYVENDPSAQTKLQYLQDIMGKNPKAQQQMKSDQHFRALLDNYVKNLQMSVSQQQNKQIGRTGVTPVGQQAASAMQGQIQQAEQIQKEQESQQPQ
jgi:hypothetical protein